MKKKFDSFELDDYEREIEDSLERGEWVPVPNQKKEIALLVEAARNTLAKRKMMSIRMNDEVMKGLKRKAKEKGMPYQTLVSTILYQYVNGQIEVRL